MWKLILFIMASILCYAQSTKVLNDVEKEFMARKYIKIQADMDELKIAHRRYQQYWEDYNHSEDYNMQFDGVKHLGQHCFEFDSSGKYTTDITMRKLQISNLASAGFDLYEGFLVSHSGYFIAIDDSGWVFPLSNFWIDEFHNFIKKKIGKIDNPGKAMDVVRIYASAKIYKEGGGIIVEGNCFDSTKTLYREILKVDGIRPPNITKDTKGNYGIETYVYFPGYEELDYYKFYINRNGEVEIKEETISYEWKTSIE